MSLIDLAVSGLQDLNDVIRDSTRESISDIQEKQRELVNETREK